MAPCPLSLPRPEERSRKFQGPGAFPGQAGSLRPVNEKGGRLASCPGCMGPARPWAGSLGTWVPGTPLANLHSIGAGAGRQFRDPAKGAWSWGALISELSWALHGGKAGDTASISRLYQLRRWAARPREGWCSGLRRLWSSARWWSYPSVGAGRVVLPFRGRCSVCGSRGARAEGWTGE